MHVVHGFARLYRDLSARKGRVHVIHNRGQIVEKIVLVEDLILALFKKRFGLLIAVCSDKGINRLYSPLEIMDINSRI